MLVALLDDIKSGQIRIENGVLRIESKLTDIQKQQSDWHLTSEQSKKISDALKGFHSKISIESLISDRNAPLFAADLAIALKDFVAGPPPGPVYTTNITPSFRGVAIVVSHADLPEADALQRALRSIGLDAPGELDGRMPKDLITILVDGKPVGP